MKAVLCCLMCLLLLLPAYALGDTAKAQPEHEFLVLMSFGGTQNGGDEAAFIDAEGGVYYMGMAAEGYYWWDSGILDMLRTLPETYKVGELEPADLAEVRQLINDVQSVETVAYGISACDAGYFTQTAYRTLADGTTQEVLLMQAGDSVLENMDRSAIALSSKLLDMMRFTNHLRRRSFLFPYGDTVPLSLSFERGSFFGGSRTYTLRRSGDRVHFSVQGANGDETDLSAEFADYEGFDPDTGILAELQRLIDDLNLADWNTFDESDDQVLDGDGFSLTIDYGSHLIRAKGYERYPAGYDNAVRTLEAFFGKLILRAGEPSQEK